MRVQLAGQGGNLDKAVAGLKVVELKRSEHISTIYEAKQTTLG